MTIWFNEGVSGRKRSDFTVEITGTMQAGDKIVIEDRIQAMIENHPQLLAGHSLVFRYNQLRVFVIPKKGG